MSGAGDPVGALPFTGGSITLTIQCNTDFDIEMDAEWLKKAESQPVVSGDKTEMTFEAEANPEHQERKVTITLSNEKKNLKQTIVITQVALPEDTNKNPNGTLENMTWG